MLIYGYVKIAAYVYLSLISQHYIRNDSNQMHNQLRALEKKDGMHHVNGVNGTCAFANVFK